MTHQITLNGIKYHIRDVYVLGEPVEERRCPGAVLAKLEGDTCVFQCRNRARGCLMHFNTSVTFARIRESCRARLNAFETMYIQMSEDYGREIRKQLQNAADRSKTLSAAPTSAHIIALRKEHMAEVTENALRRLGNEWRVVTSFESL